MESILTPSRDILSVLLDIIESPSRMMTGNALYKKYPTIVERLLNEDWLTPKDTFLNIIVGGERKIVFWRPEVSAYQYFTPFLGWITVPESYIKRYNLNTKQCFHALSNLFNINPSSKPIPLFNDDLYYLGMTNIDRRSVNVYLCSHLKNIKKAGIINRILQQETNRGPGLVVSCRPGITPLTLPDHLIEVTLESLLVSQKKYCCIDWNIMKFIVRHQQSVVTTSYKKALSFSYDYRIVYWGDDKYVLTRKQAAVVEALHAQGGRAHHDFLRAQANSNSKLYRIMSNKKQGEWVLHPLWDTLIVKAGGGYYRFCDDAIIDEQPGFLEWVAQ